MTDGQDNTQDDFENTLVTRKWVRIMCDDCSDGVWNQEGEDDTPEDLPILQSLRDEILAWAAEYDQIFRDEHERDFKVDEPRLRAFGAEGLRLAQEVKRQLPDWTVIYHDTSVWYLNRRSEERDMPRERFEYEIPLSRKT